MVAYAAMNTKTLSNHEFGLGEFREGGKGMFVGGKMLYSVSQRPQVQFFISPNIQFYKSLRNYFDDQPIGRYYQKSTMLNVNAGVRINVRTRNRGE